MITRLPSPLRKLTSCLRPVSLVAFVSFAVTAHAAEPESVAPAQGRDDAAEVGKQLSNPISSVWALFTEFDLTFSDGDVNSGSARVGSRMIFQPILPIPLYGPAENRWNLITRPTIPVVFSQPLPTGFDTFSYESGLGDIQIPVVVSPPTGNLLLGIGPAFLLPTATQGAFGRHQWGVGPAAVIGYKTNDAIFGVFGQYYFGIGRDNVPQASYLNLLYFMFINLPNAWQIGFDPTITYDAKASDGNKWNVPVGLTIAKTTHVGRMPVKVQFGIEYSVVTQKTYGQTVQFKFNIIPVIPSLIGEPLFGG